MFIKVSLAGACAAVMLTGCSGEAKGKSSTTDAQTAALAAGPRRFDFERDATGREPGSFLFMRTGLGRLGQWTVMAAKDAPSGSQVLQQSDDDATDLRFPLALAEVPDVVDVRLFVRARTISGTVDQAFGLVFRCRDADNYYVVRANALEGNVRLYYVKGGQRTQLRTWNGNIWPATWHTLEVQAHGDFFRILFDGQVVIDAHDTMYPAAGKVGLWTKADSVVQFDDLTVEPLVR